MEIFTFIYFLGITYIVFNLIWFFIAKLPGIIFSGNSQSNFQRYLLKSIQYFFLATLTAVKAIEFSQKSNTNYGAAFVLVGGLVLYLYLVGKLQRNQMMVLMKTSWGKSQINENLKYEPHLVGLATIIYVISFNFPALVDNPLNTWFLTSIIDIKNTIIIGWIIGFIGVIFMVSMVLKGINATGRLIEVASCVVTGKPIPEKKVKSPFEKFGKGMNFGNFQNFSDDKKDTHVEDDLFVDFEVIEDEEEDTKEK